MTYTIYYRHDSSASWELHSIHESKQDYIDNLVALADWEWEVKTVITANR